MFVEEQRVRISDIAQELGLSTATVSNVIHGKTKKISDETVKRVMALLEERQYIPSMAGILLAQNSSKIIGVFVNDHEKYEGHTLDDFFIASSLNYLSTEIEAHGQFMMVKKAKSPEDIIKFASMWNMDGIVVIGFCDQDYMYLRSINHPCRRYSMTSRMVKVNGVFPMKLLMAYNTDTLRITTSAEK